jgi:hypothetical protein
VHRFVEGFVAMAKDDKKGKKQASPDDIMSVSEIRPLLKLAKGGKPVSAVVGLSAEGEAVLLMHKQAAPKKLRSMLIKQAQDAGLDLDVRSVRFGRATTDEADEGVLKLTVNREPSGSALHMQVKKRVKPAGFGDVVFITDPSIENESEDGEAPAAPGAAHTQTDAAAPPAAPPPQPEQPAAPQAAAPAPPPAPAPQPAQPDMSGLTRRLGALIPQVATAAPDRKAALSQLANAAAAAVKGASPDAAKLVDQLERTLQAAPAAPPAAPTAAPAAPPAAPPAPQVSPADSAAKVQKSRAVWVATRRALEGKLDTLLGKMADAYKDHAFGAELEKHFHAGVEPILSQFDHRLAEALDGVSGATDAGQQKALLTQAQQIVASYEGYLASEKLIRQLDANPFVPGLNIEATLTASLDALNKTLASVAASVR